MAGAKRNATHELHAIEEKITELLRKNEKGAWQVGKLIDQIATTNLHLEAGYASLDIYLDERFPQGYSTLRRFRRVYLAFDESTVVKHGTSKLEAGLTYLEAAAAGNPPRWVLGAQIKVPRRRRDEDRDARSVRKSHERRIATRDRGGTRSAAKCR